MSAFTTINGKPVAAKVANTDPLPVPQQFAAAPAKQTHHADCGDVGATGEHGAIGSNAADAKERQAK